MPPAIKNRRKRHGSSPALFEWPVMAFMGVLLGLFARVAVAQGMFNYLGYATAADIDAEMGLPLLLRTVLPVGLMGLMMAAYFSAIMSTADSCLMASSGNFLTDILSKWLPIPTSTKRFLITSQLLTLILGIVALLLASRMPNVLELMLYSYAFMVSGLFVPVMGALFLKKASAPAAFWAMLLGGSTTITLIIGGWPLPLDLDPNIFGISLSFLSFVIVQNSHFFIHPKNDQIVWNSLVIHQQTTVSAKRKKKKLLTSCLNTWISLVMNMKPS
jgi:solute:Na+ symporter, SSS family